MPMADNPIIHPGRSRRKLVGQPLLYSISVFVSLGVFLVRFSFLPQSNRSIYQLL